VTEGIREALLSQTDRATRCISRNVINCHTTAGTSCKTNPEQIEVIELQVTVDRRVIKYVRPATSRHVDHNEREFIQRVVINKSRTR